MALFNSLLKLAEMINGDPIKGQFAKDMLWILGAIAGFWLLVLIILTPYWILRYMFGRK